MQGNNVFCCNSGLFLFVDTTEYDLKRGERFYHFNSQLVDKAYTPVVSLKLT